ncbi:MAG: hypothetical protein IJ240_00065 [Clostridia bacterium]|nr:hypothetical protein [Clostridia bacterium]
MKYFRKLIWYGATRLLIVCLVLGLLMTGFYLAMNASNIYIILKDGMARRAQVVMQSSDEKELSNYFSSSYLASDPALSIARNGNSPYQLYYSITGFDHRLDMESVWCWPWEDTARATVRESIPAIDGKLNAAGRENAEAMALASTPPKWRTARYQVILTQENGHWHIKNMNLIEYLDE